MQLFRLYPDLLIIAHKRALTLKDKVLKSLLSQGQGLDKNEKGYDFFLDVLIAAYKFHDKPSQCF